MNIVSLVLRIHPATRNAAEAALRALPGVECHHMSDDGRLVATVEDNSSAAVSDTLIAIHRVPQVLAATLAYEHSDTRSSNQPDQRNQPNQLNSPCEEAQS
jgi:nitrate reductase NapAB chaperone NapD